MPLNPTNNLYNGFDRYNGCVKSSNLIFNIQIRRVLIMVIEEERNRDVFFKFCFIFFLSHVLKILEIDEEIEDVLPTETITFKKARRPKFLIISWIFTYRQSQERS